MSNQYDDARQDAARSTPEPDNEPLSSRARTPLGTTRQLTAKRSQYNQPEKETTMSDENTNFSNPEVQPVDSEPQTATTPADTTTENDLQAAKLKKANEDAKSYRLKLRDPEHALADALKREEQTKKSLSDQLAALTEQKDAQLTDMQTQLDAADHAIMRYALADRRTYMAALGAPLAGGVRVKQLNPDYIEDVMGNLEYWLDKVYGERRPISDFTRGQGSARRLGVFMRRLSRIAPHMFAPADTDTGGGAVASGMGGQRYTR